MTQTSTGPVRATDHPPAGWDERVRADQDATFCHLSVWGDVLREVFDLDLTFAFVGEEEDPDGVMPLVRMPRLGLGHALVSMPYLNYGGPVGTPDAKSALADWALQRAKESGARRLELRCRTPVAGAWPEGREKVTVVLDLPDEPEVLFEDRFRSKLRSQIRRPMKEDMEVRFGPDTIPDFYEVFAVNMRDLGTPVLPRSFFEVIAERFGEQVEFAAVYHEGQPVAGGGGFLWKDEFEITWASSLREFSREAPNMLLYWSLMEQMIERGIGAFNFGRCTPGGGTHRFKSQWGGDDEALSWIGWPEGSAGKEDDGGGTRERARRLWSRLPLPVANVLGPRLVRRIPEF